MTSYILSIVTIKTYNIIIILQKNYFKKTSDLDKELR